jgi:hypothetical protein
MAPAFDLVDVAKEIQRADEMLANVTSGKLVTIAEQMRALKGQAEKILERARRDAELHRAKCNFEKTPGMVLHLYERDTGELYFSLLAPHEWSLQHPQTFKGSYRLEADMSFSRVDEVEV